MSGGSRRIRLYIAGVAGVAAAAVMVAFRVDTTFAWQAALGFTILFFLAEQFPVTVNPEGTSYSVSFVITLAACIAVGPAEAALTPLLGAVFIPGLRDRPLHRHVFNAAQLSLSTSVAALVYWYVGGPELVGVIELPEAILPLVACTATTFLVNTGLVSTAVALHERRSPADVWRRMFAGLGRTYIPFALLGVLLAALYVSPMRWGAVLFLLMPLLVARHAFQAAVSMQGAYDATVRSLITAIEAKDTYTRGHAERVSRLSEMVARTYGLSEERCRAIRYAALMHDVGKLVVQSAILQKPGKLTPEEYEHMKSHPLHGVEIVSEIELLEEAIVGVRHHHERMDGKGYPDGLAGDDIPLFARLITVCDAFDSMTSTRTYRLAKTIEEALAELHRCAGTQFDPGAIAALERAIERYGWEPHPETGDGPPHEHEEVNDAQVASV